MKRLLRPFWKGSVLLALIYFFSFPLIAQENLLQDKPFFEKQTQLYQRWLDHSGLGQYLRVEEIEVKEKHLSLYLRFPFSDIDSVLNAWDQLKADFEATSGISLEEKLFYKMTVLMEVRPSAASVQLYDTYDLRKEPLFFRGILFENGSVRVEESNPKSISLDINLYPKAINGGKAPSVADFHQQYSKETVFTSVKAYVQNRYEKTACEGRNPKVRILEDQAQLRFEVVDLCKEVLTDGNPTLCEILRALGNDCNWVKRELLTFTISYEKTMEGFRLEMEIDGKYGSGFYDNVRRGGYLSMEVDFNEELERYTDELAVQLRNAIQN